MSGPAGGTATLPPRATQIKVLTAALNTMHQNYATLRNQTPGAGDVFDYGVGQLWRTGIDGAGTTIALIEGWDFPQIAQEVAAFDKPLGLPDPQISTIYPDGPLPAQCPPGMVALGSYGSCNAWQGELALDVISAHLMAPYANIVISATPADSEITDDAASQVAMPEIMTALEYISANHLANVMSISDGNGEASYSHGQAEITAQDPGELAAAAAGIPVLVASGDCGVVQNLPMANAQCSAASAQPDTAAWDDSPWVTAVGGSVPNLTATGAKAGPDPVWHVGGVFSGGAGFSSVFSRPAYQNGVAHLTGSKQRSVPDITMDASDGTSEAAPLLSGVLALATQVNHGNVGPINPALYGVLGPRGTRDGIADVVTGNNSVMSGSTTVVPGFTAAKGFDVVSGWGTLNAPSFVPSLAAATKAARQDAAVRGQARSQLTALEHAVTLTPSNIASGRSSYLSAGGFLAGHPVQLSVDGTPVITLTASDLGTVAYELSPSALGLAAGHHTVRLSSLLITVTGGFTSH
jgi:subtilase family serine protease